MGHRRPAFRSFAELRVRTAREDEFLAGLQPDTEQGGMIGQLVDFDDLAGSVLRWLVFRYGKRREDDFRSDQIVFSRGPLTLYSALPMI